MRSSVVTRWVRILGFLLIVTLPLLGAIAGPPDLTSEKRQPTARPQLVWTDLSSWTSFPEAFTAYWQDAFGFRNRIIRWHNLLQIKFLRESPVPDVIIGDKGRLFFANWTGNLTIADFAGKRQVTPVELDAILQHLLLRRAEYAALGARFLIVVAPNKQTLYPESVPLRYGPHAPGALDAILTNLRSHSDLDVLDLREALRAHLDRPLYYATDTHWNANGAFVAAQAIVDHARKWLPELAPLHFEDYDVTTRPKPDGDLATMLAMAGEFADTEYVYQRKGGNRARLLSEESDVVERVHEQLGGPRPRALIFGDSFGVWLARPLAESFGRVRFYYAAQAGYNAALPPAEKPNLVILEVVERFLFNLAVD
jgi:hypothetical protein